MCNRFHQTMNSSNHRTGSIFQNWYRLLAFALLFVTSFGLNSDGVLLLSFKYSILDDPLSVLQNWNYDDATPCAWNGVTCKQIGDPGTTTDMFRVTSLVLPNSNLLGSISPDFGAIEHLINLDLSGNFLNGTLPPTIFNSSKLQVISLSNNEISGELDDSIGGLKSLQFLNLSDNAFAGKIPENLSGLENLSVVSLRSNYFSGGVPSGFTSIQVLDLSSNLLNGTLPQNFSGANMQYLNMSYNKISGPIPPGFASRIPKNATMDLSFNNLSGAIPESLQPLLDQKTEFLSGNLDLCGKPLKILCSIPSTLSTPPNASTTGASISPAIAVIPKTIDTTPGTNSPGTASASASAAAGSKNQSQGGLKPGTIIGIVVGDLAGVGVLALVILYVYQIRKRKNEAFSSKESNLEKNSEVIGTRQDPETRTPTTAWSCLKIKGEETSEATSYTESDQEDKELHNNGDPNLPNSAMDEKKGTLITVDGETELELDTLLKASAYILGASGASIVYKAVLLDGTAYAVRRIGEKGVEKFKDFENILRSIAKLKHQNLVRVRGFYWGNDEKLVIYDYVPNGSLASIGYRKGGLSPFHISFEVRLKILKGLARGLSYIHDKKHVHGNVKPSNILLNSEMEPLISDLGLDRLVATNNSHKGNTSTRQFGSQRFAISQNVPQELPTTSSPYYTPTSSSMGGTSVSPYQAPESLKNFKPNPKWDVYSYGIVLLELLTGKVFLEGELNQWTAGSVAEEKNRILRMVEVAIRADVASREDALLACFKLGFSCASLVPQKRPSMKEALQVLEKISSSSCR